MTIEVVNVGPIRHARLSPGKLNVLIGKNDTGKTFLATVAHRLFSSRTDAYFTEREPAETIPDNIRAFVEHCQAASSRNGEIDSDFGLLINDNTRAWANDINKSTLRRYGIAIRGGLSYAYGIPVERLRRQPESYPTHDSYIFLENLNPAWNIKVRMEGDDDDSIVVTWPDPDHWTREVFSLENIERLSRLFESRWSREKASEVTPSQHIENLCQYILFMTGDIWLFQGWPINCLHLPSERGGIMQSYRAITSAALRKSSFAGIERIEIEPLDGTSRDFLSFVVSPERDAFNPIGDEGFADAAKGLQHKLRATIDVVKSPSGLDHIVATTEEGQFELNRTSSMISEISAFVLALEHRLGAHDYLTIDEPEAHLHPEMQIEIAQLLVDLASKDLAITLTTHSDYFVEEINNAIRGRGLMAHGEKELPQTPQIDYDDVRALLFVRDNDGCIAIDATGTIVDPISEETFMTASREQYDKSVALINRLLELVNDLGDTAEQ